MCCHTSSLILQVGASQRSGSVDAPELGMCFGDNVVKHNLVANIRLTNDNSAI
jgi:hypothetical protein